MKEFSLDIIHKCINSLDMNVCLLKPDLLPSMETGFHCWLPWYLQWPDTMLEHHTQRKLLL